MQEQGLLKKLTEYAASDYVPFHMPGHKRETSLGITSFPNPFSVDITEIDGFDNLHHAEGILKTSMEKAAEIYGTKATWYLVNGSTGGILSAICALTRPGGTIVMARNCHKSAYHAVMLQQLKPIFVYPEELEGGGYTGRGILGGIDPEKLKQILEEQPENEPIQAIFLTSPTYEGVVSDVEAIVQLAHQYGVPVIVDEAHGAHFPFGDAFPASAVDCGADVVIQSLHKTLPSLTQTAVLHVNGSLVRPDRIARYLSVFQSSSPSYVFLAAIENCIFYMNEEGRERMRTYADSLQQFREKAAELRFLKLMEDEICGMHGVFSRDASKLVLLAPGGGFDGTQLAEKLRNEYHLEPEMSCEGYVILMTSLFDPPEHYTRLLAALTEIDKAYAKQRKEEPEEEPEKQHVKTWLSHPDSRCLPFAAWNGDSEAVSLVQAVGRISAGFVTVYPPGVPMLIPGEVITEEAVFLIQENEKLGLTVEGISQGMLLCLKNQ